MTAVQQLDQPQPDQPHRDLGDQIALLATQIDAATYRLLTLIREFDNQQAWVELDCLSCAHWLSWRLGWTTATARDRLRVAHALAQLPVLSAVVETGQVSYSKARATTRVAPPKATRLGPTSRSRQPRPSSNVSCAPNAARLASRKSRVQTIMKSIAR